MKQTTLSMAVNTPCVIHSLDTKLEEFLNQQTLQFFPPITLHIQQGSHFFIP